jgi:TetR/AcrR family tetracycline transcriptional repressor
MAFLVASGLPEREAGMAMLAAGRFTVGSVLEEQAEDGSAGPPPGIPPVDHDSAFEAGLNLIVEGLAHGAGRGEEPR